MEARKARMVVNKSGAGNSTFRATLPANWIREMGLSEDQRELLLVFDGGKIEVRKGDADMLMIKETNPKDGADYLLEDGTILWLQDWNGEVYSTDGETTYRPIYDTDDPDAAQYEIIGFERN